MDVVWVGLMLTGFWVVNYKIMESFFWVSCLTLSVFLDFLSYKVSRKLALSNALMESFILQAFPNEELVILPADIYCLRLPYCLSGDVSGLHCLRDYSRVTYFCSYETTFCFPI